MSSKIIYSPTFWVDMERLVNFFMTEIQNPELAHSTYQIIMSGMSLLAIHPQIGRLVGDNELRELVISRGKTGYIALYSYDEFLDLVHVVSIWHQRESGYH